MQRHTYSADLLRPELTVLETVQSLQYKRELTLEDYDRISESADRIKKAVEIVKARAQQK